MTNTQNITKGDRVANVFGFLGTVLEIFPNSDRDGGDIALVEFDEEKRGRIVGKQWHCGVSNLTKESI